MSHVVAVDSGGTFTDCFVLDDRGETTRAKAPSTPPHYEEGVFTAIEEAARRRGLTLQELLADTAVFAHGTTVATNVLITRTGARTALVTTRGHEDAILIGRTAQKVAGLTESEIIDVANLSKAEPLVPRSRIFGIDERVDRGGTEVVPLDPDRLRELVRSLREDGVESVAVSFLWSFLNPEHERRAESVLLETEGAEEEGRWFVTTSSGLVPIIREYERTATTVLNAYLTPGVSGYLQRMDDRLRAAGHRGAIAVMHSAGGVSSIEEARRRGVSLLSSGPAGGVLGARALAARLGLERVIATDVGGTSFDVGLIVDGEPSYAESPVFGKYPVALPVIDVPSIGSGGGSIAWIEPDIGVLRVGPRSAGARPGPACYGAGGTEPTITDANVVLGRIDPGYFLGGRIRLDPARARTAFDRVADPLGMTAEEAAAAVVEIANSQMADLIRRVTVERGLDPARFVVFGYGGAAGLHAGAYAGKLGCREVCIPRIAAVFSAFGIAVSDLKRVALISDPTPAPFDLAAWRRRFADLEGSLYRELEQERLTTEDLVLRRFVDLQFKGQVHTVRVPVSDADLGAGDEGEGVIERFIEMYEAKFGRGTAYRKAGVWAETFAVEGSARLPFSIPEPLALGDEDPAAAQKGRRLLYDPELGGFEPTPVFDAERLLPGHRLEGPALIDAEDTTVLVGSGDRMWVDEFGNLRMELGG
ncbi:MAG: hydantoinase/oxoprolinase family protein [Actinomycetota bacterium]